MTATHAGGNGLTYSELVRAVADYVVGIRDVMERGDDEGKVAVLEAEVPGLVAIMESLLTSHQPDDHGRCRACSTRWRWMRRVLPWVAVGEPVPCPQVRAVWAKLAPNAPVRHALRARTRELSDPEVGLE
ncbi:hypothetical protein F4560_001043 [Saccharothrix ecbatanensis]|uniref:Uncharacterized protein n=1 Tax=Saccharothrix ecbatanensis TaxID=1105145 RepID=A0A7W9HFH6_9PSEU|nr:hypothetical protein [Saccharothrix ecbatanensis]MBB5801275.1 hypothetical protein [Saccharothrix ecbatanensis]